MEEKKEFEFGLCVDCLIEFRDEYIAELSGEPSAYEKGKIDLFNELIELLEFENGKIQDENRKTD